MGKKVINLLRELDINVLVPKELERRYIIKYLDEYSSGLAFTLNKLVQSYGSHYVKPPIIFGDVSCPKPMIVFYVDATPWLTRSLRKDQLGKKVKLLVCLGVAMLQFGRNDMPIILRNYKRIKKWMIQLV